MKWKGFCKSDLMIASSVFTKLLLVSLSIIVQSEVEAASNQHQQAPNSFYISHRILHQHQPSKSESSAATSVHPYSSASDKYDARSNLALTASQLNSDPYDRQNADGSSESDSLSKMGDDSSADSDEHDETADQSHEVPERNMLMDHHNTQLAQMQELFERRQLSNHQLPSSQELSPISIGLDPGAGAGSPFNMPPFAVPNDGPAGPLAKPMANADNLDQGLGPALPFGLNLPPLLGFQSPAFDGPQRGDQSAHSNHHTTMPSDSDGIGSSQKVWPKIFRFTDGRINLSDFEKQKKIRLSSKNQHNSENHIESAPIMFDGRQLKRKSFLILHGGIFSR